MWRVQKLINAFPSVPSKAEKLLPEGPRCDLWCWNVLEGKTKNRGFGGSNRTPFLIIVFYYWKINLEKWDYFLRWFISENHGWLAILNHQLCRIEKALLEEANSSFFKKKRNGDGLGFNIKYLKETTWKYLNKGLDIWWEYDICYSVGPNTYL